MKLNQIYSVVQGLICIKYNMKQVITTLLLALLFLGVQGQCEKKVKAGNINALTVSTDISNGQKGKLAVVGFAEEEGYPYAFEIRQGGENGKILQSGKYSSEVKHENNKYPTVEVTTPGKYTIVTCNTGRKSVRTVTINSTIK